MDVVGRPLLIRSTQQLTRRAVGDERTIERIAHRALARIRRSLRRGLVYRPGGLGNCPHPTDLEATTWLLRRRRPRITTRSDAGWSSTTESRPLSKARANRRASCPSTSPAAP